MIQNLKCHILNIRQNIVDKKRLSVALSPRDISRRKTVLGTVCGVFLYMQKFSFLFVFWNFLLLFKYENTFFIKKLIKFFFRKNKWTLLCWIFFKSYSCKKYIKKIFFQKIKTFLNRQLTLNPWYSTQGHYESFF